MCPVLGLNSCQNVRITLMHVIGMTKHGAAFTRSGTWSLSVNMSMVTRLQLNMR